jgi:hypothetical protein
VRKAPLFVFALVGVIAVSSVGGWFLVQRGASGTVMVDQLSPRAQDFITADTSQGQGLWTEVNLEDTPDITIAAGSQFETPCYRMTLLQRTLNHKVEESEQGCVLRARSLEPAGTLMVSSQLSEDFETNTGVALRKDNPDLYTFHAKTLTGWPVGAVYSDGDSVVAFGWRDGVLYTVALSGLANTSPEKIDLAAKLLESIETLP